MTLTSSFQNWVLNIKIKIWVPETPRSATTIKLSKGL